MGGQPARIVRIQTDSVRNESQSAPDLAVKPVPADRTIVVHGVGIDRFNDPSAGSPTETLLRLLLPLGGRV